MDQFKGGNSHSRGRDKNMFTGEGTRALDLDGVVSKTYRKDVKDPGERNESNLGLSRRRY